MQRVDRRKDSSTRDAAVNFRPAVSTDIGATVRVLAADAFTAAGWLTSCALAPAVYICNDSQDFCSLYFERRQRFVVEFVSLLIVPRPTRLCACT